MITVDFVSEFEKYQVSVSAAVGGAGGGRRLAPLLRPRDAPPYAEFDALEPGAHCTVTVKTMSGKVTSWPASADFTLSQYTVHVVYWLDASLKTCIDIAKLSRCLTSELERCLLLLLDEQPRDVNTRLNFNSSKLFFFYYSTKSAANVID